MHVCVVGAGAFGSWTALCLRERGCDVTLVEAIGPGHSGSSSGGETRVVRAFHGDDVVSAEWGARALAEWARRERAWNEQLVVRATFLWLQLKDTPGGFESTRVMDASGIAYQGLDPAEIASRYPQMAVDDVAWGVLDEGAGYAWARYACQRAVRAFAEVGGIVVRGKVLPLDGLPLRLQEGGRVEADAYVVAGGPWLPQLVPELAHLFHVSRQPIFYFQEPGGSDAFSDTALPAWATIGQAFFYGAPGNAHRGFKLADDSSRPPFDPDTTDRVPTTEEIETVRTYLGQRFPGMAAAPLTEARVCQYTNTPDEQLVVDRHPAFENVWVAGGGSGRGFKHGPIIGQHVADLVMGTTQVQSEFALARFAPS